MIMVSHIIPETIFQSFQKYFFCTSKNIDWYFAFHVSGESDERAMKSLPGCDHHNLGDFN
jgi:hypothetical protein